MHLSLRAPSIWYVAALHADSSDFHAVGFTLPGVPGIVVGHNRSVAWGYTNGMVDDMDFAVETSSDDGQRYLDRGEWIEYTVRAETLQVRGADPEVIRVRESRRGPIVSDILPGLGADLSAVWTASTPEARSIGLWELNRARSLFEFDRAVQGFAQPHQNVVFASIDGRIGYRLGGRVPLRGDWDGSLPVEAERMGDGFRGTWPPAAHPSGFDPPAGFFATANNLQAPGLGTAISTDYAAPLRAERITRKLAERSDWSVDAVYALQHDTYSLLAERYLPLAIATARRTGRDDAAARLEVWDRRVDTGSLGAPLFYSWLYRLRSLIAADEYAEGPEWAFFPLKSFMAVLEEGDASPWIDDVSTPERETLDQLAAQAMDDAAAGRRRRVVGRTAPGAARAPPGPGPVAAAPVRVLHPAVPFAGRPEHGPSGRLPEVGCPRRDLVVSPVAQRVRALGAFHSGIRPGGAGGPIPDSHGPERQPVQPPLPRSERAMARRRARGSAPGASAFRPAIGAAVPDRARPRKRGRRGRMSEPTSTRILVVGAGPCGLAVGAAARRAGVDCILVDKGPIVSSIERYPIGMTFFSTADHSRGGRRSLRSGA